MQRTKTIRTILVEGNSRIICVKLFENWTRVKEELSFKSIFNGPTDEGRSQKLTLSLCDR